jgi:hypothetical protein
LQHYTVYLDAPYHQSQYHEQKLQNCRCHVRQVKGLNDHWLALQLLSIVDPVAVTRLLVVLFAENPQMITRSAILTYVSISVVKSFR